MPLEPTDKGRRADRKQKKRVAERKVKSHELGALADVASPSQRLSEDADDMDTQTDTYMDTPDRKQKKRVAGRKMRSLELGALADMTSRSHQRLSEDDDGMDTQADAHKDTPSRASQLTKILHSVEDAPPIWVKEVSTRSGCSPSISPEDEHTGATIPGTVGSPASSARCAAHKVPSRKQRVALEESVEDPDLRIVGVARSRLSAIADLRIIGAARSKLSAKYCMICLISQILVLALFAGMPMDGGTEHGTEATHGATPRGPSEAEAPHGAASPLNTIYSPAAPPIPSLIPPTSRFPIAPSPPRLSPRPLPQPAPVATRLPIPPATSPAISPASLPSLSSPALPALPTAAPPPYMASSRWTDHPDINCYDGTGATNLVRAPHPVCGGGCSGDPNLEACYATCLHNQLCDGVITTKPGITPFGCYPLKSLDLGSCTSGGLFVLRVKPTAPQPPQPPPSPPRAPSPPLLPGQARRSDCGLPPPRTWTQISGRGCNAGAWPGLGVYPGVTTVPGCKAACLAMVGGDTKFNDRGEHYSYHVVHTTRCVGITVHDLTGECTLLSDTSDLNCRTDGAMSTYVLEPQTTAESTNVPPPRYITDFSGVEAGRM